MKTLLHRSDASPAAAYLYFSPRIMPLLLRLQRRREFQLDARLVEGISLSRRDPKSSVYSLFSIFSHRENNFSCQLVLISRKSGRSSGRVGSVPKCTLSDLYSTSYSRLAAAGGWEGARVIFHRNFFILFRCYSKSLGLQALHSSDPAPPRE